MYQKGTPGTAAFIKWNQKSDHQIGIDSPNVFLLLSSMAKLPNLGAKLAVVTVGPLNIVA